MNLSAMQIRSELRCWLLAGVLACLSLSNASFVHADEVAQAQEDIATLYANWRNAVANSDIPAYLQGLDAEVRLLPPGAEPIVGAANYGKFLEPVFAAANYRLEVLKAPVIEVMGDVATVEYEYNVHIQLKDDSQGIDTPGALTDAQTRTRYFDVLRKSESGRWGVWRHTWHTFPN